MPKLLLTTILSALLSLSACTATHDRLAPGDVAGLKSQPLVIVEVANLSGRPLRDINEKFWTSDSLTVADLLSGSSLLDIPEAFRQEVTAAMKKSGWTLADTPETSPATGGQDQLPSALHLRLAITDWDTSRIVQEGVIGVGAALVLVRPSSETLLESSLTRDYRLLQPLTIPGGPTAIVGEARVIEGRYRQIISMLARELLTQSGLLQP